MKAANARCGTPAPGDAPGWRSRRRFGIASISIPAQARHYSNRPRRSTKRTASPAGIMHSARGEVRVKLVRSIVRHPYGTVAIAVAAVIAFLIILLASVVPFHSEV